MTPETLIVAFGTASALFWLVIVALPWRPWRTGETLDPPAPAEGKPRLDDVDVLIPARNEADTIRACLEGVREQGLGAAVWVIDDRSRDGTSAAALSLDMPGVTVLKGSRTPPGWSGKLWALEQGLERSARPYMLLLDADIRLAPGVLPEMRRRLRRDELSLISVMAELPMRSAWEKLLVPAFIYFFKLIYPFRLSNSRFPHVAAAAGGCVLVRRDALSRVGAFGAIQNALIDDCALAARIKRSGGRTWIGLSRSVVCVRPHEDLASLWRMVTRTAYVQLRHSAGWLGICTITMILAFPVPFFAVLTGTAWPAGIVALAAMTATYWPITRYYGLAPPWALTLPIAGFLFLIMTWASAIRYWRGVRSIWKGRVYYSTSSAADGSLDKDKAG